MGYYIYNLLAYYFSWIVAVKTQMEQALMKLKRTASGLVKNEILRANAYIEGSKTLPRVFPQFFAEPSSLARL